MVISCEDGALLLYAVVVLCKGCALIYENGAFLYVCEDGALYMKLFTWLFI